MDKVAGTDGLKTQKKFGRYLQRGVHRGAPQPDGERVIDRVWIRINMLQKRAGCMVDMSGIFPNSTFSQFYRRGQLTNEKADEGDRTRGSPLCMPCEVRRM